MNFTTDLVDDVNEKRENNKEAMTYQELHLKCFRLSLRESETKSMTVDG